MKNCNPTLINRRSFVHAAATTALLPHSFLSAAQQFMAPSQWHGVGPVTSDGSLFVVGNTYKHCLVTDFFYQPQSNTYSTNAIFLCSLKGHQLGANMHSLSQQINLLAVPVSDPGGLNAVVGFNDLAHAFDQQIIGTDFEDLVSLCSNFRNDQVTIRISVGSGQGEQAGYQALQAALLNIQPLNGYQTADVGPAIMTIAANAGTLRLKMVRDLCDQLKTSALRHSDTVVTLAMDQNVPQHAVRVTLLARQQQVAK